MTSPSESTEWQEPKEGKLTFEGTDGGEPKTLPIVGEPVKVEIGKPPEPTELLRVGLQLKLKQILGDVAMDFAATRKDSRGEAIPKLEALLAQEYSRGAEDIIRKIQHELKVEGYGKSLEQIVEAIRVEKLKETK